MKNQIFQGAYICKYTIFQVQKCKNSNKNVQRQPNGRDIKPLNLEILHATGGKYNQKHNLKLLFFSITTKKNLGNSIAL